jgi:uncharacterized membrane protein
MPNWRASLGLIAVVAVLLAMIMPVPAQDPAVRIAALTQDAPSQAPSQAAALPAALPQAAQAGELFRGMISVEGKQVPLPAGDWHLVGRAISPTGDEAAKRNVVSLVLVRLKGLTVDSAVLIQTNRLDDDAAWGKATACDRTDLYFARVRYASDHDGSCAYVAYVNAGVKRETTDPAWQETLLRGAGMGWRFPLHWVEAAYRITDPRDALQVRYLFNMPDGASGRPPQDAVRSLVTWTEASWFPIGSGFRNRLGAEDSLPDWRQPGATDAAAILPQAGRDSSEVEHLGTKMITYRIFGTMTDMSVNYLWLGSLPSAGGLAVVGAVASSALYFVHELVWSHFERPPILVGDLPGVGTEGPGPV